MEESKRTHSRMDILPVALKIVTCFYLSMNFISCLSLEDFSLDGATGGMCKNNEISYINDLIKCHVSRVPLYM